MVTEIPLLAYVQNKRNPYNLSLQISLFQKQPVREEVCKSTLEKFDYENNKDKI